MADEFQKEEQHKMQNSLRDVILGGQDGLVNALGIILGIVAAGGNNAILLATVFAAAAAESISMGAVVYTSALSQKAYYDAERKREEQEVEKVPEKEREEIREIYREKGFSGKSLEEIVKVITSDKKIWVDTMMAEELHIEPVDTGDILKSSVIVTIATTIGHLIPVLPFLFNFGESNMLITSIVISGLTLFAVGAYQAVTLVGSWWKTGLKLVVIGLGAALIGYVIAKMFNVVAG
jgi:vacuolar iron transporter family protein